MMEIRGNFPFTHSSIFQPNAEIYFHFHSNPIQSDNRVMCERTNWKIIARMGIFFPPSSQFPALTPRHIIVSPIEFSLAKEDEKFFPLFYIIVLFYLKLTQNFFHPNEIEAFPFYIQ